MPLRRIGRCAVFGELASGGMATVYLGRLAGAAGFARRVAIKSLHAQFAKDPDFLAMFLDEARLSGRIQHPNVVRVLDVIASDDELHLVMEYIEGESLSKLVRLTQARGERVPVPMAVSIMVGVLDGLHAAHEARGEDGQALEIVHRDVSPHNVLVGVDGMARILDFGIAKAVGRMQSTRGDQLKGKLAYMAPEHLAREALDRRADVYAAGIMLWELLTGERLFQAEDEITTFRRALEGVVPAPSTLAPNVPESLDRVVLRALARKPEARQQSARELSSALEATGLAASPRELAAWLQSTAEQSLSERAARIAEYESAVSDSAAAEGRERSDSAVPRALAERWQAEQANTAVLEAVADTTPPPRQRSRAGLWMTMPLIVLLIGGWWVWPRSRPPTPPPAPSRPLPAKPTGVVSISPLVPPSSSVAVPAPAPSPTVATRAPGRSGGAAKKARRSGCETPFTVDARGVKVPKLECL